MIYGSILYRDYSQNSLFEPGAGENNGEFYLPYRLLRERFLAEGIELNTPDQNVGRKVAFELHINCRRQNPQARAFVYLYENPLIRPLNRNQRALARYVRWFTWDGELLNDPKAVQLFYPNDLKVGAFNGPESRPLFCVLVSSNKALAINDSRDQYQDRVRLIKWYEKNAPHDFHLYGRGWDRPAALPGRWGRVYNQFLKIIFQFFPTKAPFQTWRGPIDDKIALLRKARFCIAHENTRDLPGYFTEKLFDCFRAGCVPIYIGPREIHQVIPSECFIDGRKWNNPEEMNQYLHSLSDEQYRDFQKSISDFLCSPKARPFSQEHFVETIVSTITNDLK